MTRAFLRQAAHLLREQRLVLWIAALYLAAAYAVQSLFIPGMMNGMWYLPTYLLFLSGGAMALAPALMHRRWQIRDGGRRPHARPRGMAQEPGARCERIS